MARVRINHPKAQAVLGGMTKRASKRAADALKRRTMNNIVQMNLVNTGRLLNSWNVRDASPSPLRARHEVYTTDENWAYPEYGRRGFAAAPGKVLAFKPKGASVVVFAKKVGPVRPYRYLRKARASIKVSDYVI